MSLAWLERGLVESLNLGPRELQLLRSSTGRTFMSDCGIAKLEKSGGKFSKVCALAYITRQTTCRQGHQGAKFMATSEMHVLQKTASLYLIGSFNRNYWPLRSVYCMWTTTGSG